MDEERLFKANGKLLLTGEYLVLKGAWALAMPVRFGQQLKVTHIRERVLQWTSVDVNGEWFSAKFDLDTLQPIWSTSNAIARNVSTLLNKARPLHSFHFEQEHGFLCQFEANYPIQWGLGSSSTLIYLVSRWMGLHPFAVQPLVSNGSGYDVACADQQRLVYFRNLNHAIDIKLASPGEALRKHSCFAYLGKKIDSASEVDRFHATDRALASDVERISELATAICTCDDPRELCELVAEHENIMENVLDRPGLAHMYDDFRGAVKYLGAWGGDFAMFVSDKPVQELKREVKSFGLEVVFSFEELGINQ